MTEFHLKEEKHMKLWLSGYFALPKASKVEKVSPNPDYETKHNSLSRRADRWGWGSPSRKRGPPASSSEWVTCRGRQTCWKWRPQDPSPERALPSVPQQGSSNKGASPFHVSH